MIRLSLLFFSFCILTSCTDTIDKLKRIDKAPDLSMVNFYQPDVEVEDTKWYKENRIKTTNSLWYNNNSSNFFKDTRTWHVGDLIRIVVKIDDSADLNNSTEALKKKNRKLGIPSFLGLEKILVEKTNNKLDPKNLISTNSDYSYKGEGEISRAEDIKTEITATVIKILSNGNLLVSGHQEVRVNYELRQIKISGIIRTKDITSNNTINANQIAEARISYGGKGIVSDVQQPNFGSQLLNIISPF